LVRTDLHYLKCERLSIDNMGIFPKSRWERAYQVQIKTRAIIFLYLIWQDDIFPRIYLVYLLFKQYFYHIVDIIFLA